MTVAYDFLFNGQSDFVKHQVKGAINSQKARSECIIPDQL